MSNHWHGVVSDPQARLPEFLERFHRLLARAQNVFLGRCENLWSSEKTSVVLLASDEDVLEKMAYTIANPTAAGLVRSPSEWPGVISLRIGEQSSVEMPELFFNPEGPLPACVTLTLTRPAIYPDVDLDDLSRLLANAVQRHVEQAREALAKRGLKFLGAKAVLQQSFEEVPKAPEQRGTTNPRIAAAHSPLRTQMFERMLTFWRTYRAAWQAWRSGKRDQVFPAGTYALRVHAGVCCALPCPM